MADELCRITTSEEKDLAVLQLVRDALELSDREEFLGACAKLLDTGRGRLVIDMRGLRRIFSIFVGTVMDVNARARKEGRHLTLMASEEVTSLFRTIVSSEVLDICPTTAPGGKNGRRKSGRISRRGAT